MVSVCLPVATAHRSALSTVYDELRCGKEKLTAEDFLECASNYCAQQVTSRRKQQTTSFMTMNDTLFQALDANNNGYLTPKEWEGIFYMWNYPEFETIAVEAFKAVDKSKDGKISPEEFRPHLSLCLGSKLGTGRQQSTLEGASSGVLTQEAPLSAVCHL